MKPKTKAPTAEVDGARLMQSCAGFAERMKLSGTADELASIQTIEVALAGFGYRTQLISHDAYISLPGPAHVEIDGQTLRAITHSFSLPSPKAGLTAPVVDVGRGEDANFAGRALAGCIVLADGIASPAVAARVLRAGAVGQLHISPHEHLHEMCISPVWGSPGLSTRHDLPAAVTCTISQADGAALRDRLAHGEALTVTLHAEVDTGWRKTPILQADLDGPDPEAEFVLFSGHQDTWYFGVMDNGAANATMIETARVLAQHQHAWKRGLRLCFWSGHSHGRYSSSAWYVDNHWDELDRRCAVHVNVDSTGAEGATDLTQSAAAAELTGLAAEVLLAEAGAHHKGKRPARNSDMSFWGVGIPSLFGSLSMQPPQPDAPNFALGWWWHTPDDLLDKIDPAHLLRDTQVFVAAIWRLLTDEVLPLDYASHAEALLKELKSLEHQLNGALSLQALHHAAQTLRDKAASLSASPAQTNQALMQAARALVPADNTTGDRFTHDPALAQNPWPILDPIRALAKSTEADRPYATIDAIRAKNRMLHTLQSATRAFDVSGVGS